VDPSAAPAASLGATPATTGERGAALVDVRDLRVGFGDVRAVDGVSLQVRAGQAVALVGRNGAGKSTTHKVLGGVQPATSAGRVHLAGADALTDPLGARRVTGYGPDVGGLVPRATPWEHLQLAARMRALEPDWPDRARALLEQFDLGDVAHRVCAGFSHGMSRRLSVLLAGFHRPRVLLLDEPFDGVDPLGVDATLDLVQDARSRGAAVLVSTHLLDLAVRCCDDAVVLRGGRQVAALPAAELTGEHGTARYRDLLR
jgi:ABC-2 type transport system ATP-binding protein